MAVLTGEISSIQGNYENSITRTNGELSASQGNSIDSLLKSEGTLSTNVSNTLEALIKSIGFTYISQSSYQYYLSSLARFFGVNARQTTTQLIIQKADLDLLSPKINNTAESLLTAIFLRAMQHESNTIISKVAVTFFKSEFLVINLLPVIRTILLINFYVLVTRIELYEIVEKSNIKPTDF